METTSELQQPSNNADNVASTGHFSASTRYITMFIAHLKFTNRPVPALLESQKLTDRQDGRMPVDELLQYIDCMNECVGTQFGLDIGRRIHPSDYGIIGHLLMNALHLEEALQLTARYTPLMCDALRGHVAQTSDSTVYTLDSELETQAGAPIIELYFASLLYLSRFLVGGRQAHLVNMSAVYFKHAPLAKPEVYEEVFGCPVYFHQSANQVTSDNKVLKQPVYSPNPYILKLISRKTDELISRLEIDVPFQNKVFQYVLKQIPYGAPSAVEAAHYFNMSLSTLKKYLLNENANYTQLCDLARQKLALNLIHNHQLSLKEIAVQLGFSNSSAFHRAFKRWTGYTPKDYRQMHDK